MTEDEIRAIVREEIAAWAEEQARKDAEWADSLAEMEERKYKRERIAKAYEQEERWRLEDRIRDLEARR